MPTPRTAHDRIAARSRASCIPRVTLLLCLAFSPVAHAGEGGAEASGSAKLSSGRLSAEGSSSASPKRGKHFFRIEGGAGILVGPQADRFRRLGGGGAAAYEFRPLPYLGIEPRYTLYGFRIEESAAGNTGRGFAHMAGAHLRIYPIPNLKVGQLWLGAGPEMVFTAPGADNIRGGVSAGTGFEFNAHWAVAVGPFLRYSHIFQPNDDATGPQDGQFFQTGLSVAFGGKRPSSDKDGDGVNDKFDECVDTPEDLDGHQDLDGCPELDNDSDGFEDRQDGCPDKAGVAHDDPGLNGCPGAGDRDDDGIDDASDICPDHPEDADGRDDADGCPDLDHDGDKIFEPNDACPEKAETINGFQDEDGCPDLAPNTSVIQVLHEASERVYFDTKGTEIGPEAAATLQNLAATLAAHPEIELIRIEASASGQGSAAANQRLSERRATALADALVRLGVDPARIEPRGYGSRKFEGHRDEGGSGHRRAVFRVMKVNPP